MKYIGIGIAIMLVSISIVSLAQETYTREQYMAMLPTLDKVDLSKMPTWSGGDTSQLSHRTWYFDVSQSTQAMFQNAGIATPSIMSSPNLTICMYVWKHSDNAIFLIIPLWDRTTNQIYDVVGIDWIWNTGFTNEFPKTIADYSIQDLPLISIPSMTSTILLLIVGISIVAGVGYIFYRHRK